MTFARAAGLTSPDPWQSRVLLSPALRTIILACRQSGKSTVTGIKALRTALYQPGSLTLIMAPSLRQSGEFFATKVRQPLARLAGAPARVIRETTTELEFSHGSRIVVLPGTEKTTRGFSDVQLLVIDEASRADDALYPSAEPMVRDGGEICLLSTPFGARGFFHRIWDERSPEWHRVKVTAPEVPRKYTAAALEAKREELGEWWYDQEYLCIFKDATDSVFTYEQVMATLSADVLPLE